MRFCRIQVIKVGCDGNNNNNNNNNDLEVMKEIGIVFIEAGSDGEDSRCVQVHIVGISLLRLKQEF